MQTAVLNIVGLTPSLIGEHSPNLARQVKAGQLVNLQPVLPAVTCSVQASMLTGQPVGEHGIVANGWYHRDTGEVRFRHRSNRLVEAEQVWQTARRRDPSITCASLFWWHNTHADADVVLSSLLDERIRLDRSTE
ncbi:MAG: alkaline phosphatase family protein [Phycisphaeraceae bacterium]